MTKTIVCIVLSGLLGVVGQLLLKLGTAPLGPLSLRWETLPGIVLLLGTSPLVLLGVLVCVAGTGLWLLALERADLSYAYPFASLNYGSVLIASWLVLGERPSPSRVAGVAIICAGVVAVSRTRSRTDVTEHVPRSVVSGDLA